MPDCVPFGFAAGARRPPKPLVVFPKPSEAVLDVEGVINENAGAAGLAAPNSEVDAVEAAAPKSVEEELAGAPKREGGAADVVVEPKVGAEA